MTILLQKFKQLRDAAGPRYDNLPRSVIRTMPQPYAFEQATHGPALNANRNPLQPAHRNRLADTSAHCFLADGAASSDLVARLLQRFRLCTCTPSVELEFRRGTHAGALFCDPFLLIFFF